MTNGMCLRSCRASCAKPVSLTNESSGYLQRSQIPRACCYKPRLFRLCLTTLMLPLSQFHYLPWISMVGRKTGLASLTYCNNWSYLHARYHLAASRLCIYFQKKVIPRYKNRHRVRVNQASKCFDRYGVMTMWTIMATGRHIATKLRHYKRTDLDQLLRSTNRKYHRLNTRNDNWLGTGVAGNSWRSLWSD